ncbi:MAG TPA: hypothetical protein VMO52_00100 [Acidimicrobiia bacterium]|nr:hypothetical protein [Acidimicrobiia bacterium]
MDSATLGVGQFCTKPGVVVGIGIEEFANEVRELVARRSTGTMLTPQLGEAFSSGVTRLVSLPGVDLLAGGAEPGTPTCLRTDAATFRAEAAVRQEVFGPMILLVSCTNSDELLQVASILEGQLTGSIHAESGDADLRDRLAQVLVNRVGRLIYNGYPTGVSVAHAMRNRCSSDARSTGFTPSTPAVRPPRLPLTRLHATARNREWLSDSARNARIAARAAVGPPEDVSRLPVPRIFRERTENGAKERVVITNA